MVRIIALFLSVMVVVILFVVCCSLILNGVVVVIVFFLLSVFVRIVVSGIITSWSIRLLVCNDWLLLICSEIDSSVVLSFLISLIVLICVNCDVSSLFFIGLVGFWFFSCVISKVRKLFCKFAALLFVSELLLVVLTSVFVGSVVVIVMDIVFFFIDRA